MQNKEENYAVLSLILIKTIYDSTEENTIEENVRVFTSDNGDMFGVTAHRKVNEYINSLPSVKLSMGGDSSYPRYHVEPIMVE